jgi:serine/threonine protein phosphatase 1
VDPERLKRLSVDDALRLVHSVIPAEHVEFFRSFSDTLRFGDYLFVHAGIRPGVDIEQQRQSDLRWIREPFLTDDTDHGFVVVHGHTIRPQVEERPNRIGIDTGAYSSGILTALAIEGAQRWYVDTRLSTAAAVSPPH